MEGELKTAIAAAVGCLVFWTGAARAQQFEATPRPPGEQSSPYLRGDEVNFRDVLGPFPAVGSLDDRIDLDEVEALQTQASPERFKQAEFDADHLFPAFSDALGVKLDRATMPITIRLLYNAIADAGLVANAGKTGFDRARPYQRVQLTRVCDFAAPPDPKAADAERSSYPSGHSTEGWTTALVLGQVAPGRRLALLGRARDYALSRVVCGVHYPSDTEGGRAVATAVFERLMTTPAFQRDLGCARAEYQALAKPQDDGPAVCERTP